jgi:dihydrodipicolinate synthase/N-acetylneuraminate lyase
VIKGALAAALTPLRDDGAALDEDAFEPYVDFLAEGGLDGMLALGTTGEGILLSAAERRRAAELFVEARPPGFQVAVHAGAQTTADSVALAAHALRIGADAVALIAPPYYPLDAEELTRHFVAVASACDPVPFYLYEFVGRSGYAIPVEVVERVRGRATNLRGLKVSDTPFDAIRPYLGLNGLDVFIGSEPLVLRGLDAGAIGAVSGLGTAFPHLTAALVHERSRRAHQQVTMLREGLAGIPFHAALKEVLASADVLTTPDVRSPLRGLTEQERATVMDLAGRVSAGADEPGTG